MFVPYPRFKPLISLCPLSTQRIFPIRVDPTLDPTIRRSNLQITQLIRHGQLSDARHLFDQIPSSHRDVITWSSLISGYIRCGRLSEARLLFDRPDSKKNVVAATALLSGYARSSQIQEAQLLFFQIPEKNVITYNTMLEGFFQNDMPNEACDLFHQMPIRNVASWNAMLSGLSQVGRVDEAYGLFCKMEERDVISWTAMLTGFSLNGRVDEAREVFDRMPERNVVSWNAMVTGYAKNGRVDDAVELFEKMPVRDAPSWNGIITGLIQNGKMERARKLFDEMGGERRNVVTWTTVITGYVQGGENEKALELFLRMVADGVRPNEGTFVNVLAAVSNLAGLQVGQQIHQMISKSFFQCRPFVNSALINMYSKCGEIGMAQCLFRLSVFKDLVCWNAMIAAFAHHGLAKEAFRWFENMRMKGLKPNDVTYIELLSACSHSGLVDDGLTVFRLMVEDGSVEVREDHYTCLVDLCSRAGRLEEAVNLIKGLEVKPPASVWGALLGGCNNHGNVKIAYIAAKRLLEAEPNNAGTYTLLSNVYASAGKWEEAKKIRVMMKNRGLKKQPGCSWIDVGRGVHVFVVHDKSHSERDLIYSVVKSIHHKMRMAGHVPSLDDHIVNDKVA